MNPGIGALLSVTTCDFKEWQHSPSLAMLLAVWHEGNETTCHGAPNAMLLLVGERPRLYRTSGLNGAWQDPDGFSPNISVIC
jgi:hypothetical protein